MSNPVSAILKQCSIGFTARKKALLTLGVLGYLISPLDIIPDILLPFGVLDDGMALFVLIRVWLSPTLPAPTYFAPPRSPVPAAAPVQEAAR